MNDKSNLNKTGHSKLMHYGMMVCCAVMLLPVAGFFLAGGTIGGLWSNSAAFLPIVICVGAHVVMHKMMGKSCHGTSDDNEKPTNVIPLLTDTRTQEPQSQKV